MRLEEQIARSRLIPPRPRLTWVQRPRVDARLREAFQVPVTIVRADPGYDKTTAVAQMVHDGSGPAAWCSLTEAERDPVLFLAHLIFAVRTLDPGKRHARPDAAPGTRRRSAWTSGHRRAGQRSLRPTLHRRPAHSG